MKTVSLTPAQFRQAFRTETQCRAFVFARKYPDGFTCKHCSHAKHHEIERRGCWECAKCGYQESAKAGTLFHKSKLPLTTWFQAIFEITIRKGGISALELQHRLGRTRYQPVWEMLHKLRVAMMVRDERYQLKGEVELDGAIFGRKITGTATKVYLAVESKTVAGAKRPIPGYAKALVSGRFTKDKIGKFAKRYLGPHTKVRTDGGVEVHGVKAVQVVTLNRKVMAGNQQRLDKHLPWVHTLISNTKSALVGTHHGVSAPYLQLYLSEQTYRFNRRRVRNQLQTRLVTAAVDFGKWRSPAICG